MYRALSLEEPFMIRLAVGLSDHPSARPALSLEEGCKTVSLFACFTSGMIRKDSGGSKNSEVAESDFRNDHTILTCETVSRRDSSYWLPASLYFSSVVARGRGYTYP